MKKVVLAHIVTLVGIVTHAQIYIGLTEAEITSRVKSTETLKLHHLPDGVKSLALEYSENAFYVRRYFIDNKTNKCYLYVLQPKSQTALDTFIKFCNENYEASDKVNEWMTNICLSYSDGYCIDKVNIRVQLRHLKAINTRMFFFIPVGLYISKDQ